MNKQRTLGDYIKEKERIEASRFQIATNHIIRSGSLTQIIQSKEPINLRDVIDILQDVCCEIYAIQNYLLDQNERINDRRVNE
jgi:hypothetical protein